LVLDGQEAFAGEGLRDGDVEEGHFSGEGDLVVAFLLLDEGDHFFLALEFL
jgi:hypothetical protein